MSLKSVFHRKTSRNYDSDSTGYGSSSDTSSPLTGSQFILRPVTVLSSYSNHSACEKLNIDDYAASSCDSSSWSSRTTSENVRHANVIDCIDDDDCGSKRTQSLLNIKSLKCSTTSKLAACKSVFSSLTIRPKKPRTPLFHTNIVDELSNTEDFLDFNESISSRDENEDVSIDDLFNALKMQEESFPPPNSNSSLSSTIRRKQIVIKEPDDSSKIYFDYRSKKRKPMPFRSDTNTPRSILKKVPSLCHTHLYEEVEGDHLSPLPDDVRPQPPRRPQIQPIRLFPPCSEFQPRRLNRFPPVKRRQKLPSLHHTDSQSCLLSWPSRLRQKIFHEGDR
ncbi:hypothetical protein V3C99_007048 [Haemonchus contortus]